MLVERVDDAGELGMLRRQGVEDVVHEATLAIRRGLDLVEGVPPPPTRRRRQS